MEDTEARGVLANDRAGFRMYWRLLSRVYPNVVREAMAERGGGAVDRKLRTARASDSGRERRPEGPVQQRPGRSFLTTDSVGCIIVTTGLPKTTACVASEVHARNPSLPYI
jgi:hypothetical protein